MKLNAGIVTPLLQETKSFYQRVLGFTVKYESDWYILLQTPNGEDQLAFLQPGHPSQDTVFQKRFTGHGVFLTIEVDDVDARYQEARSMNIPIVVAIRDEPWGDRHFAIRDPNGLPVDIVRYSGE